jgi:hypothetical protein
MYTSSHAPALGCPAPDPSNRVVSVSIEGKVGCGRPEKHVERAVFHDVETSRDALGVAWHGEGKMDKFASGRETLRVPRDRLKCHIVDVRLKSQTFDYLAGDEIVLHASRRNDAESVPRFSRFMEDGYVLFFLP